MILEYGRELEKVESDIRNGSGIYSKECHVYLTDNYILNPKLGTAKSPASAFLISNKKNYG